MSESQASVPSIIEDHVLSAIEEIEALPEELRGCNEYRQALVGLKDVRTWLELRRRRRDAEMKKEGEPETGAPEDI